MSCKPSSPIDTSQYVDLTNMQSQIRTNWHKMLAGSDINERVKIHLWGLAFVLVSDSHWWGNSLVEIPPLQPLNGPEVWQTTTGNAQY